MSLRSETGEMLTRLRAELEAQLGRFNEAKTRLDQLRVATEQAEQECEKLAQTGSATQGAINVLTMLLKPAVDVRDPALDIRTRGAVHLGEDGRPLPSRRTGDDAKQTLRALEGGQ